MRCLGSVRLNGELLYCTFISGRLRGLAHAMAVSCNVAFAKLAALVGRQRILEEYELYGLRVPSPSGEGTEPFGSVFEPYGDDRPLANLAIGLDDSVVTPLHAALQAAVTADALQQEDYAAAGLEHRLLVGGGLGGVCGWVPTGVGSRACAVASGRATRSEREC